MADEFDANEFLSDAGIDPSDDTPVVKLLRKKVTELGKALKAKETEIATFHAEQAKAALADTWKDLGVPEALRGFYTGEQNADAIKTWWESSKSFFNLPAGDGQDTAATQETQQHTELQDVAKATALGSDPAGNLSEAALKQIAAEASKLSANNNPEKLAEFYAKLGIPKGVINVPHAG